MPPRKKKSGKKSETGASEKKPPGNKKSAGPFSVNGNASNRNTSESQVPKPGTWLPEHWIANILPFPTKREHYMSMYQKTDSPVLLAALCHVDKHKDKTKVHKGLTPYQLEKQNIILFPEWYSILILRIAELSDGLKAYCMYSPVYFPNCFAGTPEAVAIAVSIVKKQFSDIFKDHLGPLFGNLKGTLFTREYIETDFLRGFGEVCRLPLLIRKNQVVLMAKNGNFRPLLDYLEAYCVPQEDIWLQFLEISLPHWISEKHRLEVISVYNEARLWTDIRESRLWEELLAPPTGFEDRIDRFEQNLRKKGLPPFSSFVEQRDTYPSGSNLKNSCAKNAQLKMPKGRLSSPGLRKMAFQKWLEREKAAEARS